VNSRVRAISRSVCDEILGNQPKSVFGIKTLHRAATASVRIAGRRLLLTGAAATCAIAGYRSRRGRFAPSTAVVIPEQLQERGAQPADQRSAPEYVASGERRSPSSRRNHTVGIERVSQFFAQRGGAVMATAAWTRVARYCAGNAPMQFASECEA